METSDKKSVQQLVQILWRKGLSQVVISPGSRNAPLTIGFTSHQKYTCFSVPDERSAAFIALGIAEQTGKPVGLVCSSGSALLNYYPAIAEAFYRHIPLVILSADRPMEFVDQAVGQTIRQNHVFNNHIVYQTSLDENPEGKSAIWFNSRKINEALNAAVGNVASPGGPVHLNLPFEEPLYHKVPLKTEVPHIIRPQGAQIKMDQESIDFWQKVIPNAPKIVVLIGQKMPNPALDKLLNEISSHVLILSETTSNVHVPHSIGTIDRFLIPLQPDEELSLQPDVLITFGGFVVSKKIKSFFTAFPPKIHVQLEANTVSPDPFQSLTHLVPVSAYSFFSQLKNVLNESHTTFVDKFLQKETHTQSHHKEAMAHLAFSDLLVMHHLASFLDHKCIVHLANSATVRYAQLFNWNNAVEFRSNRGTSGIDGIVSTAVGTAIATSLPVWLVVGDISFFYDSNALWNSHLPPNLKILVVNNNGGGIFRIIDGPKKTGQLETHFETQQKNSVEHICKSFSVPYLCATNIEETNSAIGQLHKSTDISVLEIITPQVENDLILKNYFKKLQ